MVRTAENYRRFLDPAVLAEIRGLDLRARLLVQGFVSGMHHSPLRGVSVEFAEYRKYCQGDDLRYLDWKVFGRTDKHYVKQYEQETNLRLLLAVDCSGSMTYRSEESPLSKREYAATIATAMAYLALHQSDAVAVATFDDRLRSATRASNNPNTWKLVLQELQQSRSVGTSSFRPVMDEMAESLRERHMIIILSDFLGDATGILNGIRHLRHRRHEPIVFHILDRAELTFPFTTPTRFDGLEAARPILGDPQVIRDAYLRGVESHINTLRRGCRFQQADYALIDTSDSMSRALSTFLATRSRRTRRHT